MVRGGQNFNNNLDTVFKSLMAVITSDMGGLNWGLMANFIPLMKVEVLRDFLHTEEDLEGFNALKSQVALAVLSRLNDVELETIFGRGLHALGEMSKMIVGEKALIGLGVLESLKVGVKDVFENVVLVQEHQVLKYLIPTVFGEVSRILDTSKVVQWKYIREFGEKLGYGDALSLLKLGSIIKCPFESQQCVERAILSNPNIVEGIVGLGIGVAGSSVDDCAVLVMHTIQESKSLVMELADASIDPVSSLQLIIAGNAIKSHSVTPKEGLLNLIQSGFAFGKMASLLPEFTWMEEEGRRLVNIKGVLLFEGVLPLANEKYSRLVDVSNFPGGVQALGALLDEVIGFSEVFEVFSSFLNLDTQYFDLSQFASLGVDALMMTGALK